MRIDRVANCGRKLLHSSGFIIALAIATAAPVITAAPSAAQERTVRFGEGSGVNKINIPIGQSRTLRSDDQVGELVVGDSEIADVFPLTSNSLYVLGKAQGTTNVAVYDPERRLLGVIEVEVGIDSSDLGLAIRQVAPNANVRVQSVNGRLRLSGSVPDSVTLTKVLEIASQYGSDKIVNAIRVTTAQQVNLEVRFIEADRSASRELGISWSITDGTTGAATGNIDPNTIFSGFPAPAGIADSLPSGNVPFGTLVANVLSAGVRADVVIQALEEKGLARRLAEPNLTALSGETASFLAGGEVPIPVDEGDGNISIEFKEFGVRLAFTPVVLDNGLINLVLEPEVSDVDFTRTIRTEFNDIPSFITRRARTTVQLRDGQSFAIAGLLQSVSTKNADQVPWLGQLPIIGALFRSQSFQKQDTDLVIIVTPRLVRPAKPGEDLRSPLDAARSANDVEYFLLGMMEVDEDMLRRFENGEGVIGPYGHIVDLSLGEANVYSKK